MQFKNVSIVKQANIYLDGLVTSRTLLFPDGSKKSLGIMMPGEFKFKTSEKETKEIISGVFDVLLEGETEWKRYTAGTELVIPGNCTAEYKVHTVTDYCLSFETGE
ncbi:pyrimidine/purine nucleoside phosphorylase [Bacillus sp. JJ1773]|uniref:pyrimidine/purine nucleoside phosphorylase n=1 Tax=Bacillus sp. JJ1773 TaxID=3122965 RepID=UPI003000C813